MCGNDEFVNVMFVVGEEGMDLGLIEKLGALGLGKDEVREEGEADVGVKGQPVICISER